MKCKSLLLSLIFRRSDSSRAGVSGSNNYGPSNACLCKKERGGRGDQEQQLDMYIGTPDRDKISLKAAKFRFSQFVRQSLPSRPVQTVKVDEQHVSTLR